MRRLATLSAFALAGALSFTGCDSTGVDALPGPSPTPSPAPPPTPAPPPAPSPGGPGPVTFLSLEPQATFLRTQDDPDARMPAIVALDGLGLAPGDVACFEATGDFYLGNGLLVSAAQTPLAIAIFSDGDLLDASTERVRVIGAVGPDAGFATPNTILGDLVTDVPEDFDATDACVTVPANASHVFVGAWDGYYSDNARTEPDAYGVRIWRR